MSTPLAPDAAGQPADIELRTPADSAYLSVLRTTAAGLAARLDFTLDDIEDLRIAVGEAGAMLLPQAEVGSRLEAGFTMSPGQLTVEMTVTAPEPVAPARDDFAWQVLTALTSEVDASVSDSTLTLVLTRRASTAG